MARITNEKIIDTLRSALIKEFGQDWKEYAISPSDILTVTAKSRAFKMSPETLSRRLRNLAKQGKVKAGAKGYYMLADNGKDGE